MKKAKLFLLGLILPVLVLTGCATQYQKEGVFTNGYSDFQTSLDRFIVTFRANEHTPAEKVLEYSLRRAAHLTLKNGFRYFTILDQKGLESTLHFPSLRLSIQCYHSQPIDKEWIDATTIY